MGRPRDKKSSEGLLARMEARRWADGVTFTYRYLTNAGKWVSLGTDKQAALRKVLDLNGDNSDRGTLAELWRLYKDSPSWAELTEGTRKDYEQCWIQLEKVMGKASARAINPPSVARYLRQERAAAPVRANREVALLSNLMNVAVERGDIPANPCKQVKRNKERPRTESPEPVDLAAFLKWAQARGGWSVIIAGMAEFAALGGNRRMEFRQLHWTQVGDVVRMIRGKQRGKVTVEVLAISDALQNLFDRMRPLAHDDRVGAVFPQRNGSPYAETGFKTMWQRLMKAALEEKVIARRFTFHDLRAYYVTQHKAARGSLPDLHANPGTTARVYDRSKEVKRSSL